MESHSASRDSRIVQITLAYDEGDDVSDIAGSLVGRREAGLPRRGAIAEQAPLILAGGISYRVLAAGLVKLARGLKDVSIYVEIRRRSGELKIFKGPTPGSAKIVVMGPDGCEEPHGADVDPEDLAGAIEDASE
ncbi:MAG TPA: hypothetical protein VID70_01855 [Solirubrobacteraceae bacterium]|jgi:hypothetical protein